ncbi:MAG: RNA polymerase sigma factor [Gammaproteobacteria bacterium]
MRETRADSHRRRSVDAEDLQQLRRVAAGDRRAFEALYIAYHRRLSRFLMRFVSHYPTAEEIINDTMLAVWQQADKFAERSRVSTWIMGIAYRRAMKTLRREPAPLPEALAVGNDDELRETRDWIAEGLARLPLEQRMALELAYFFGCDCEEIAQIAGCSVNTVKTRLFHARRRLRSLLPRLGGAQPEPGAELR